LYRAGSLAGSGPAGQPPIDKPPPDQPPTDRPQPHPTAAFAAQLARDPASAVPHAEAVAQVLTAHPDFDLAGGNITHLLRRPTAAGAGAIAALDGAPADLEQVTKDFPNMRSLFGQGDMCQCEDCRSVHGAAAYLVDVLEFLRHRLVVDTTNPPPLPTKTARDVL